MPNIFDFIPDDNPVVPANPPQMPPNIFDIFDSIPATSNGSGGVPINSDNAQLERAQFLATILHPPVINPTLGVHQPSMFSSGFFPGAGQPISLQHADDWGFTAAATGRLLNNAVTRDVGWGLDAAGQAIKGGVESDLFKATGQPDLAAQEKIATIAKMFPQLGLDVSDPYEDARQTLPAPERIASGIGPGFLQSAPQMALTAVQPELGAVSFGFTPRGFDPVQAATMMIAPFGGKIVGGVAKDLAVKTGINDAQALDVINRLGGGAGVASLISAPSAYQIAQMQPGPERKEAIQDAASNAIIASILGGLGEQNAPEKPDITTADTAQNTVPEPTVEENLPVEAGSVNQQPQQPISEKLDRLATMVNNLHDMLRGRFPVQAQQAANGPTDQANQIIRNVFPAEEGPEEDTDETFADGTSQSVQDSAVPPAPIASGALQSESPGAKFQPSGDVENSLTPNQIQQSIQEAINEKHAKINIVDASNPERAADVVRRQAQSAFSEVRQGRAILANTIHDPDFYGTEIGQRLQAIAGQNGLSVVFYKGDENSPKGFFNPQDGNLYLRTDVPQSEMAAILEHEGFHQRAAAGDVAAQRVIAGVDPNSLAAQKIAAKYNSWLAMHGKPPLSPEQLREEIGAFHVSGQSYEGIAPSDAFKNPAEALTAAEEYHSARPMEGPPAEGDLRFAPGNSSEEKGRRASIMLVTDAINQLLGSKQLPAAIRVTWDRTAPWVTKIQGRGTIVMNAAQISTPEQAQQAILREGLRDIWYQPPIQNAWQYMRSKVSANEMTDELKRRQIQGLRTDPVTIREEAAIARVMNSDGRTGAVGGFHNVIRTALKEKFGINVPATARPQLKEAATEFLRNRTVQAQGLGLPPNGMIPLGQWGEAWLSHVLRRAGIKPSSPLKTRLTYRFPDRVVDHVAHESKAGLNVKLNDRIRTQILKDADLVRTKQIDGAHWHFFQGAQPDVLKFLDQNGIGYTVY